MVLVLLALTTAPALAAEDGGIVTNVWASAEECPPETAKKIDFAKLAGEPSKYAGRCVRVEGLWLGGRAFYSDSQGFYAAGPKLADLPKPKRVHRIGLYAEPEVLKTSAGFSAAKVTVTGIAGTCRGLHGKDTIMVFGYCHYTGGGILKVSSLTATPQPYTRFIGAKKRKAFSNLAFAPEGWRHRSAVEARALAWLRLIQKRDRDGFAALNGFDPDNMDAGEARILRAALDDSASPFADFHRRLGTPPSALFIEKDRWEDEETDPRDYQATACYCRSNDCEESWPISDFDAPSAPARPYICARLWQYMEGELTRAGLDTLVGPDGWTEKTKK